MLKINLLLLVAALTTGTAAPAQNSAPGLALNKVDVAVTYTAERAKAVNNCGCFWLQGGGIEAGAALWHNLGPAASFTGMHTNAIGPQGVGLGLITATFGPRYRYQFSRVSVYGEGLVGIAHGFDSVFPATTGQQTSRSALAVQLGGGIDAGITPHLAVRPVAISWVHTQLDNGTNNVQDDLRVSAGLVLRFGRPVR